MDLTIIQTNSCVVSVKNNINKGEIYFLQMVKLSAGR